MNNANVLVHYIIPEEKQVGGEIKHLQWEVCQKKGFKFYS